MITFKSLGQLGGMGNQMFQIAATIGIAANKGHGYCFPKWEYQDFFINRLPNFQDVNYETFHEPHFHYADFSQGIEGNIDLFGYFQSPKYWKGFEITVRGYFLPKTPELTGSEKGTCAIHVRRGDYLKLPGYHTNLPMEYYYKAMEEMGDKDYTVFSDDIEWCKGQDWNRKVWFEEEKHPAKAMIKMAGHDNNIIANSSFSWWAAYISPFPNKRVIAPKQWFGPKANHNTKDLYLPLWQLI